MSWRRLRYSAIFSLQFSMVVSLPTSLKPLHLKTGRCRGIRNSSRRKRRSGLGPREEHEHAAVHGMQSVAFFGPGGIG